MKLKVSKRKLLKALGFFLALGLLAAALQSFWGPPLIGFALRKAGVSYAGAQRLSQSAMRFEGIRMEKGSIQLTLDRLTLQQPVPLAWNSLVSKDATTSSQPIAHAVGWRLVIEKSERSKESEGPDPVRILDLTVNVLNQIKRWVPYAILEQGTIQLPTGAEWRVPEITWLNGGVNGRVGAPQIPQQVELQLSGLNEDGFQLNASVPEESIELQLSAGRTERSWSIAGALSAPDNRLDFGGDLQAGNVWPESAFLKGTNLRTPRIQGNQFSLEPFEGAIEVDWSNQHGVFHVRGAGGYWLPAVSKDTNAVEIAIQGEMNPGRVTVDRFDLDAALARLTLESPLRFPPPPRETEGEPRLALNLNLNDFDWNGVGGEITAAFHVVSSEGSLIPQLICQTSGSGLEGFGLEEGVLTLDGGLYWPAVNVDAFKLSFPDTVDVAGSASYDIRSKTVNRLQVNAGILGLDKAPPIPESVSLENAALQLSGSGSLQDFSWNFDADAAGLTVDPMKPFDLELSARGGLHSLTQLNAAANFESGTLALEANAHWGEGRLNATVSKLDAEIPAAEWRLWNPGPIEFEWAKGGGAGDGGLTFQLQTQGGLTTGGDSTLEWSADLDWPKSGGARVNGSKLNGDWLPLVASDEIPQFHDWNFELEGQLGEEGVNLSLDGSGGVSGIDDLDVDTEFSVRGDEEGIRIHKMRLYNAQGEMASIEGLLPVRLQAGDRFAARETPGRELQLDLTVNDHPEWNRALKKIAGLELANPQAGVSIRGALWNPRFSLKASAQSISKTKGESDGPPIPELRELEVQVQSIPDNRLEHRISMSVLGNAIELTAETPMPILIDKDRMVSVQPIRMQDVRARIQIPSLDLKRIGDLYAPDTQARGALSADVRLGPDLALSGSLVLRNGSVYPGGGFSSLQNLNGEIRLEGSSMTIASMKGEMSQQPVQVTGTLSWPLNEPWSVWPDKMHGQIQLAGERITVLRKPEMVLRASPQIEIHKASGEIPVVRGKVRLMDGYYTADFQSLMKNDVSSPARRPPYFSVEAEPLAAWKLDLDIEGDQFMRVRSTFFIGSVSTEMKMQGTLKEPLALGEIHLNSARIQFPFGNMDVTRGIIYLNKDSPYDPSLDIQASTQLYNYRINLKIDGTASKPGMTFTSTPPLSSEEILLMLTAGRVPRSSGQFSSEKAMGRFAFMLGKDLLKRFQMKETGEQRIIVRSGQGVTNTGKTAYTVEYKLSDDWSLVGEYDEFSAFNGGLKWKFYSK